MASWLPLSLIAAPYVWSYDHTLLVIPLILGAGIVARSSRGTATLVIVLGSVALLVVSTVLAVVAAQRDLESYSAAIPLFIFAVLVSALWPTRRAAFSAGRPRRRADAVASEGRADGR